MRLHRSFLIVAFAFTLTACGSPKSFDVQVRGPMHTPQSQPVNVMAAASAALLVQQQAIALAVAAGNHAEEQPRFIPVELPSVVSPPTLQTTVPAATSSNGVDWHCVAVAETGADFTMHGSTYSTAYGVVNDIVEDYASPEVAAKVFAGTASEAEQTDIVARFAADHGTGGWGELTKSKCNL